jgi:Ca2+:H+ antiporter
MWQLKLLTVFVPITLIARLGGMNSGLQFAAAFLSLIPLAGMLGDFTEDVVKRSNEVIGALINVTFGNATELIISFFALKAGQLELIKFSLVGSILGNMLLVLGTALLVGGLRFPILNFSSDATNTYIPLLSLSVVSFIIPSGFSIMEKSYSTLSVPSADVEAVMLSVSRQVAIVTSAVYLCYLWFQLVTHKTMFDSNADAHDGDREEEEDAPEFTLAFSLWGLAIVSLLISYCSDVLVDTVDSAAQYFHLPHAFIGIILVPIIGNAAEHATAIIMASRNRMDVAVGVAMGSSIQIALFVMPLLVIAGWIVNVPLDMYFHPFPTALLFGCVLVTGQVVGDGKSNWLEGVMLVATYFMMGVTFLHGDISMAG